MGCTEKPSWLVFPLIVNCSIVRYNLLFIILYSLKMIHEDLEMIDLVNTNDRNWSLLLQLVATSPLNFQNVDVTTVYY